MGVASFTNSGVVNYAKFRSALAGEDPYTPPFNVEYVVIAGGGSGGNQQSASTSGGGGGGAGGYRSSVAGESSGGGASAESALGLFLNTAYTVTIGAGGAGPSSHSIGSAGTDSVFSSITSDGGGAGGGGAGGSLDGGSGGGGNVISPQTGGSGTANQGFDGGDHDNSGGTNGAAGGGGAGAVGGNNSGATAGAGGAGVSSSITGSAITRAGGGGGSAGDTGTGASGGSGGGGKGADGNASNAFSGAINTGGGGGGHGPADSGAAGNGGSGVVIIRYPSSVVLTGASGLVGTTTTVGENKVTQITAGTGTITFQASGAEAFPDFSPAMLYPDVWLDASDASTITASSGSVSQWDNKGTQANFVQGTGSAQPTTGLSTLNGLNVINFSDDWLNADNSLNKTQWKFLHDGTTYFHCTVVKFGNIADPQDIHYAWSTFGGPATNVGAGHFYDDRSGTTGNDNLRYVVTNGTASLSVEINDSDFGTQNAFAISSALIDPDNATAANRIDYYSNNTQGPEANTVSAAVSTSDPTYPLQIGADGNSGSPLVGSIAEIVIVSGANATEANRQAVVDYLNAKWGVF